MTMPRQTVPVLTVNGGPGWYNTRSPHALGALLSQYAHGGNEFSLVVELVTGVTLAEACLRGES